MKFLIINKLSITTLPLIIIFRLLNYRILFIKINNYFKNKKFLKFLSFFQINWFNYQDYKIDNVQIEVMTKAAKFSENLANDICNKYWCSNLEDFFENKKYLVACLGKNIYREAQKLIEIMSVAKNFENSNDKVFLWISNNVIVRSINSQFYHLKNLNIFPNYYIATVSVTLLNIFKKELMSFFSRVLKKNDNKKNINVNKKYENFEIACYPHKGVYYDLHLYIKDHFYSFDKKDPFYFKNMLHIEWNDNDLNKASKNYYEKNGIKYLFWRNFSDNYKILRKFIFYWMNNINLFFILFRFDRKILYFFLFSTYQIMKSLENLKKLKNLKIIMACHDELFPIEISVACRKKKITTIAIQDKLFVSNTISLLIFDFYFVAGEKSGNTTKTRMSKPYIQEIRKMYFTKMDKYKNLKNGVNNFADYKLKCVVMDYQSNPDWYKNGRALTLSWRVNGDFYKLITSLAGNYPQIKFLIKSKNYQWLHIPYLKKIVDKMKQKKNILILSNQSEWTPIKSLEVADFGIARPGSLAEEMLFIGKPVIIYNNYNGLPKKAFDFGEKIFANNFKEISEKLDSILKDYTKYNSELEEDRKNLFYKKEEGKLNKELNEIFLNIKKNTCREISNNIIN